VPQTPVRPAVRAATVLASLLLAGCSTPPPPQPPPTPPTVEAAPTQAATAPPSPTPAPRPTATATIPPTPSPYPSPTASPAPTPAPTAEETATPQAEDATPGLLAADAALLPPLAVVVENHPDARPQTGLDHADVVYETLAEGGVSRFLALFLTGDAPVVGPVRSLRHYFAFIAAEYGADVVHIGASPAGFAWRDALGLGKLDESASDPGVWRSRARTAPHNAYTSTFDDRADLAARGNQQGGRWGPIGVDPRAPLGAEPAPAVTIRFTPWQYAVAYAWDEAAGVYTRSMDGAVHRDAVDGASLGGPSVIVQFADIAPIPNDNKARVDIDLAGAGGRLLLFSRGTVQEGSWEKDAPDAPTRWLDAEGAPLRLSPGQLWVEIVPLTASVDW